MGNKLNSFSDFLNENSISFLKDISLKNKTWIRRGGTTKYWIEPSSVDELTIVVSFLYEKEIFFEVVGSTSNIFFLNSYNPDVVISTLKVNSIKLHDKYVEAACGALSKNISHICNTNGFAGYEGFGTLPGTIGAAISNNSSCYNSSIEELLLKVEVLTKNGVLKLKKEELGFSNRSSILKRKELVGVVLRAYFKNDVLKDPDELIKRTEIYKTDRKTYQEGPIGNLGSVFAQFELKNSLKITVWKLLKRFLKILKIDSVKRQKLNKKLFFLIHRKKYISSYVSDLSINCFVWKDDKADDVFFKYIKFIESVSKSSTIEIEIKQ